MDDIKGVRIILVTLALVVMALFKGYQRGAVREAVTTVLLTLFTSLLSTELGYKMLSFVNLMAQNLRGQFMTAMANAQRAAKPTEQAIRSYQLVPKEQQEVVLFLLFLIGIYLAYSLGSSPRLVRNSPPSALGALIGLLNAYILGLVLLPDLPKAVPAPQFLLNSQELTRQATETFRLAARAVGVTFDATTIMTFILLLVAVLLYWAVQELK